MNRAPHLLARGDGYHEARARTAHLSTESSIGVQLQASENKLVCSTGWLSQRRAWK